MNCIACNHRKENCIKDCFQIYFNDIELKRHPVRIHKSEVARVEIDTGFLTITDTDGIQHGYNCDNISSYHIPSI